jgi:hypothetical protein
VRKCPKLDCHFHGYVELNQNGGYMCPRCYTIFSRDEVGMPPNDFLGNVNMQQPPPDDDDAVAG